ncbi:MAG: hypothetical protein Q9202_000155 [Teloschistes flavicans]
MDAGVLDDAQDGPPAMTGNDADPSLILAVTEDDGLTGVDSSCQYAERAPVPVPDLRVQMATQSLQSVVSAPAEQQYLPSQVNQPWANQLPVNPPPVNPPWLNPFPVNPVQIPNPFLEQALYVGSYDPIQARMTFAPYQGPVPYLPQVYQQYAAPVYPFPAPFTPSQALVPFTYQQQPYVPLVANEGHHVVGSIAGEENAWVDEVQEFFRQT